MQHRSLSTEKREIERLVVEAQKGDEEAFTKLYDLFVNPLYRYVYFRCNGADTEDLLTTIFMKTWINLKKYRFQEHSFSAWIFRIAHNVVIDFYRASQTNQPPSPLDETHQDPKKENHSSNSMEQHLNREILKLAIPRLKEPYQQVIVLKFLNEMENDELAEVLGKSENSLRILQYRALRQLRKILNEMGITEV